MRPPTDTTSLRSSVLQYKWEHGRRYHALDDGVYWGANDDRQQDAEDMAHELHLLLLNGKLTEAPISDNLQTVLDVGCGTGMWAIDFADAYPSAEVIGVDLSPIQPSYVPPNCRFEIDNINRDWAYQEGYFDFIHVRGMIGCVPDWVEFHQKVLKHLKPGGWVEQVQLSATVKSDDGSLAPETGMARWQSIIDQVGEKMGNSFRTCDIQRDAIEQAGFTNITEHRSKIPIGPWPKDKRLKAVGVWNRAYLLNGLEGFVLRGLTNLLGWSYEEAQLFLVQVRKEINDPRIHAYLDLSVVTAQRAPEKAE
ncbi:S-adenosyl-L-methionine-dependent methyltransferase [Thozetella sp. PMI_491]|nr:S-adenosyl-L-methionine-dependent methyltransferase [Thozetella sp. PMI_491]